MSWARYDDELSMNLKIGKLRAVGLSGIAALGLHLLANTYCRHNGTKGLVEAHVPELLVGRQGNKLAGILVDVGMFHASSKGGWTINDYAEFHDPSDPEPDKSAADRKKELSDKRSSAGRLGGLAKAGKASSKTEAVPQQTSSPDPVPVPSEQVTDISTLVDTPTSGGRSDLRINAVADHYAQMAVAQRRPSPDNPAAFATTARKTALAHPDIGRYLARWPTAPPDAIAAWLHGDKHSMSYFHDTTDDEPVTVTPIRPETTP